MDFMRRGERLEKKSSQKKARRLIHGPSNSHRASFWSGRKGPTNDSLPSEKVVGSGKLKCNKAGQDPEFRSLFHSDVLERQSLRDVVPPSAISFNRRLPSI